MDAFSWAVQVLVPIVIAIFGSSWLGEVFARKRQGNANNDDIIEAVKKVDKRVEENELRYSQDKAEQQRLQILRFDDELRRGEGHSYEYFEIILNTISDYDDYCDAHPGFKNRKAVSAIEHIMSAYEDCYLNNTFL